VGNVPISTRCSRVHGFATWRPPFSLSKCRNPQPNSATRTTKPEEAVHTSVNKLTKDFRKFSRVISNFSLSKPLRVFCIFSFVSILLPQAGHQDDHSLLDYHRYTFQPCFQRYSDTFHEGSPRVYRNLQDAPVNLPLPPNSYLASFILGPAPLSTRLLPSYIAKHPALLISLASGRRRMIDAPFNVGPWGFVLYSVAVLWTSFQLVLFSTPAVIPVTRQSMSKSSTC
jgi:hypothetical protein